MVLSGSSSLTSDETYVSGLSFKMASISTTRVCNVTKFTDALPRTFFKYAFVKPINLSQNPPKPWSSLWDELPTNVLSVKDLLRFW